MDTAKLINERDKTYGSFSQNASLWYNLYWGLSQTHNLTVEQTLCLSMICLKLARIAANPSHIDNWDDIAGYAKLAADSMRPLA